PIGLPTGVVFSGSASDFSFTGGGSTGPARFIFATISGNIVAWKGGLTTAVVVASKPFPANVYTGLAIGNNGTANFLYAANFGQKKIDVYDKNFASTTLAGSFTDPTLPADYAPFNIQNLGGKLYVEYAKVDPATGRDLPGPGNGYVSVFDTNGNFLGRLVSNGPLSSPWGVTIAPAGFGAFPGALLVGNFGDGRINAFNPTTGAFLGTLNDEAGNPIEIDDLWALNFGNGVGAGDTGTLYFSAGYDDENHGLFGSLKPSSPATTTIQFSTSDYVVNEGSSAIDITVTRSGDLTVASTVNYTTFDESDPSMAAHQGSDYIFAGGTLRFAAGEASKTFTILIPNDSYVENNEIVDIALSNPTGAALGSPQEAHLTIVDDDGGSIHPPQRVFVATLNGAQETPPNATTGRGTGIVILDPSGTSAKVSLYFTGLTGPATASHIHGPAAPGTAAPVLFPFPTTPAATSGSVNNVSITLTPTQLQQLKDGLFYFNVHTAANPGGEIRGQILFNEIDDSNFFAREQYYDFLNRYPDGPGLSFWAQEIEKCGADSRCYSTRRVDVSAAFFFSTEFQTTGFFVYSVRRAALGTQPTYGQYVIDKTLLGPGTEANKTAFAEAFVQSPAFLAKYPASQNGSDFIDALIATIQANSGVNLTPRRPELVNEYLLGATQVQSRARVIRKAISYTEFVNAEFNPAFVLSEYFGYLRRDPDPGGYAFWLNRLNLNGSNFRSMVCAFVTSAEYQHRFGPTVTRNDKECQDLQ
ncbi:MAG TPA: TIGR03118 family protein, partial [Pyrinomonadaceae bacterium]|nr:TIGR03118 family protein [Pyrinomonadaceae bacterium]